LEVLLDSECSMIPINSNPIEILFDRTLKKPFSFTLAEFRILELKTDSGIKILREPYVPICSHEDGFLNSPHREGLLYGVQSNLKEEVFDLNAAQNNYFVNNEKE